MPSLGGTLGYLLIFLVAALLTAIVFLIIELRSGPSRTPDLLVPLQALPQGLTAVHLELRTVGERVAEIERRQADTSNALGQLQSGQTKEVTLTQTIAMATETLRISVNSAQESLGVLRTQAEELRRLDSLTSERIQRIEAVFAGSQTKGEAGENIVEHLLSALPPDWVVRDFTVGNKRVEFGLRLPSGLVVPIDSKWAATSLLEDLAKATDPSERVRLREAAERQVLAKAAEVKVYLEPGRTESFAIAAVPDPVYAICHRAQVQALQDRVAIVSYSHLVPYLLIVIQSALKASTSVDLETLSRYLDAAERSAQTLQEEVESRLSKGLKMVENSRDDLRGELATLRANLLGTRQGGTRLLAQTQSAESTNECAAQIS